MIKANEVQSTLAKHILADGMEIVMDIEQSHGSYIVDARNGKSYLDMFSMYASSSVGYNHPYIKEKEQWLGKMAINKPAMSDMYNVEYATFVDVFDRVAIPKELPHLFFVSGGALAVENALKVAFDWKTRKNLAAGIEIEASKVIHFKHAFHGRSGYTLSLTNTADPRKYMYFPKFDWPRIPTPPMKFPVTEENLQHTIDLEQQSISQIIEAIGESNHDIAALIIEPIQSEGGDNHFRNEFFKQLREICNQEDIFLIFDEVQTGMGITGTMWAYEQTGIIPDAISFGKKTQVCGILVSERVNEVPNNCFTESSRINSTFGGNFIDMIRFQLILEIIEKDNLLNHAKETGSYLLKKIEELAEEFPDMVTNPRGKGLLCAFDLPNTELRNQFRAQCLTNQLIILGCGTHSIRFRPHLTVSIEEINQAIEICKSSLLTVSAPLNQ